GLVLYDILFDFICKTLSRGQMHTKGILRKEELILMQVTEHTVRPMEHAGFHEGDVHVPKVQFFTIFNRYDLIIYGEVIMKGLDTHLRGKDLLRIHLIHYLRETT